MSQKIGRITMLEKLGKGGSGELYFGFAQDEGGIRKPCAIKKLNQASATPQNVQALRHEARLLSRIHHSNIAAFHEFASVGEDRVIVMEYVSGISLKLLMKAHELLKAKFDLSTALYIAYHIAVGLEYLHRFTDPENGGVANLVHGDLTPVNVMVSFEGEVKLIDFGLSRLQRTSSAHDDEMNWATVQYASPQRLHQYRISADDDIFGLGLLLWEMIAGQRYWDKLTPEQIRAATREFKPRSLREIVPSVPEKVESIVHRCLEQEGFARYHSSADLFADLHEAFVEFGGGQGVLSLRAFLKHHFDHEIVANKRRMQIAQTAAAQSVVASEIPAPEVLRPVTVESALRPEVMLVSETIISQPIEYQRDFRFQVRLPRFVKLALWIETSVLGVGMLLHPQVLHTWLPHPLQSFIYLHERALDSFHMPADSTRDPASLPGVELRTIPFDAEVVVDGQVLNEHSPTRVEFTHSGLTLIGLRHSGGRERWFYIEGASGTLIVHLDK